MSSWYFVFFNLFWLYISNIDFIPFWLSSPMYSCFDLTACRHWWMCCWKSVWKWNLQECNRRFWMHLRWGIWAWTNDDLRRWDSHVSPGLSLQLCAKTVPWFRKQLRRAKQLEKKNYGLLEQCIVSWNRKIGSSFLIPLELWYLFPSTFSWRLGERAFRQYLLRDCPERRALEYGLSRAVPRNGVYCVNALLTS